MQISISILSTLRDRGYRLQAHCQCTHFALLDLDALIAIFGPDFNMVEGREAILAKLKCSACGRRPIDLVLMPPKQWGGAG